VEGFLTQEEIELVLNEAINPIYKDPTVLTLGMKKTDIVRVTPIHELILINGNTKTGLTHINQRHIQFQEKPKWIKQKDKEGMKYFKLDKPSFFHSSIVPIWDYPKIADELFKPNNLNIIDNRTPDFTDLYTGIFAPKNYEPAPYRLLLYKGTKIIHNLYPITDKFSPVRVLNFKRGTPSSIFQVKTSLTTIEIPYYDQNKVIRYKIIFHHDNYKMIERIFIKRFKIDGTSFQLFYISERQLLVSTIDQKVLWQYEFCEYPTLERIILAIESINKI
jgi:hypothetical protein